MYTQPATFLKVAVFLNHRTAGSIAGSMPTVWSPVGDLLLLSHHTGAVPCPVPAEVPQYNKLKCFKRSALSLSVRVHNSMQGAARRQAKVFQAQCVKLKRESMQFAAGVPPGGRVPAPPGILREGAAPAGQRGAGHGGGAREAVPARGVHSAGGGSKVSLAGVGAWIRGRWVGGWLAGWRTDDGRKVSLGTAAAFVNYFQVVQAHIV